MTTLWRMLWALPFDAIELLTWRVYCAIERSSGSQLRRVGQCQFFGDDAFGRDAMTAMQSLEHLDPELYSKITATRMTFILQGKQGAYRRMYNRRFPVWKWLREKGDHGIIASVVLGYFITIELRETGWLRNRIKRSQPDRSVLATIDWMREHRFPDEIVRRLEEYLCDLIDGKIGYR